MSNTSYPLKLFDTISNVAVNDIECKRDKIDEKDLNKDEFKYYLNETLMITMYIEMKIIIKFNIICQTKYGPRSDTDFYLLCCDVFVIYIEEEVIDLNVFKWFLYTDIIKIMDG